MCRKMSRNHIHKRPICNMIGDCIGYEAVQKGIKIVECEKQVADSIIVRHHYSHKVTKNSFVSLVVLHHGKVGGRCSAVTAYAPR